LNVVGRKRDLHTRLTVFWSNNTAWQHACLAAEFGFAVIERKQWRYSVAAAFPIPGILAPQVEPGRQQNQSCQPIPNLLKSQSLELPFNTALDSNRD
jgi:hypothetical protein